jgi:hypothetical protein
MDINDPLYVDGSVELLQSSGAAPTVFFADGGLYFIHEYVAAGGGGSVPVMMSNYLRMMGC